MSACRTQNRTGRVWIVLRAFTREPLRATFFLAFPRAVTLLAAYKCTRVLPA